jgi:hypothetical protein
MQPDGLRELATHFRTKQTRNGGSDARGLATTPGATWAMRGTSVRENASPSTQGR